MLAFAVIQTSVALVSRGHALKYPMHACIKSRRSYFPYMHAAALRASGVMPQPHQANGLVGGLPEQAMTRDGGILAPLLGFTAGRCVLHVFHMAIVTLRTAADSPPSSVSQQVGDNLSYA